MAFYMACLLGHKWDGCKCSKCGKIRNEQHDWVGCICNRCKKNHNWVEKKSQVVESVLWVSNVTDTAVGHDQGGYNIIYECSICGEIKDVFSESSSVPEKVKYVGIDE